MNRLRVLSMVTESGTHHAPFIELRIRLGRADQRAGQRGGQHQFADALLGVRQVLVAERLGHQQGEAEYELALGEVLRRALMRRMRRIMRAVGGAVQQRHVAVQEHALPRHLAHRRRTRCSPSPRSASRADGRNASARGRSCRGRGSAGRGAPHGIAKATANGLWSSECWPRRGEYTAISSAIGPSVARTRAPRTTRPRLVSLITRSAVPSCRLNMPEALRLRCRLISECVRTMSFSRMNS